MKKPTITFRTMGKEVDGCLLSDVDIILLPMGNMGLEAPRTVLTQSAAMLSLLSHVSNPSTLP
ncbi:MAG: hypothetical protein R3C05_02125 [Pirellulaceae bacterium]